MVGVYRLRELGFRLASGAHILPREVVEPIAVATELVDEARRMADGIVADAQRVHGEEKERGYSDGLAMANLAAVERLLEENRALELKLQAFEDDLSEIVVTCVRRLVDDFDDERKALSLVRASLRQMRRQKKAEVRVAISQYAQMREAVAGLRSEFPELDLVDVVAEEALIAPNVIVETSLGRVEGNVGRALDDLAEAISRTARSRRPQKAEQTAAGGPP